MQLIVFQDPAGQFEVCAVGLGKIEQPQASLESVVPFRFLMVELNQCFQEGLVVAGVSRVVADGRAPSV